MYFSIAESLTNAAKHSRASEARVTVRLREGNVLWARVEDNGMGGAQVIPGGASTASRTGSSRRAERSDSTAPRAVRPAWR